MIAIDGTVVADEPPGDDVLVTVGDADPSSFTPSYDIDSGIVIEITGPHVETGTCDVWPIRYHVGSGTVIEGFIDERDLRPAG